ncbi:MAG: WD40 repeat domain-containing protein [Saprospiraceae bacterium]|nr:WD40 repeat domain-containing protein [Saprospiraceae bacterium]
MTKHIISFTFLLLLTTFKINAQELSIQTGHSSTILDLEFSPDDKILASCGADNKIILWDMFSSKQMKILNGHKDIVNRISIHPTKNIIASASDDNTVKIWEYPSGKLLKTYDFFNSDVKSVSFKPDGTELACGSNYVYLINLETDTIKKLQFQAKNYFNAIAYSPDNKYLAFGGEKESKNLIYDLSLNKIINKIRIKSNDIVFTDTANRIYFAGDKGVLKRFRVNKSIKERYNIKANYSWNSFYAIALNSDYFVSSNKDKLIYVYSRNSGRKIETLKAHQGEVKALAISSDGKYLASAGKDRKIIIWSLEERQIVKTIVGGAKSVNSISFSRNGNEMFIAYNDGSFKMWNLANRGEISFGKYPVNKINNASFRNELITKNTCRYVNSKKILIKVYQNKLDKYNDYYVQEKEKIVFWEINAGGIISKLSNLKSSDYKSYLFVDTNRIISFNYRATHSQKYSLLNHKKIKDREIVYSTVVKSYLIPSKLKPNQMLRKFDLNNSFKIMGDIYYETLSTNAKTLLTLKNTTEGILCELWDVSSGKLINSKNINKDIQKAAFSSDESYFCLADANKIYLYKSESFLLIDSLDGSFPLDFSPDSKLLSFTNSQQDLILYNISTLSSVFKIKTNHQTEISDIKFNSAHNYIATSSYDGLIKFWGLESGNQLISLAAFEENDFICVSPDNYYFSTKGAMNYIGFLYDNKIYSFDQFDLKFNRPDKVMSHLDYIQKNELSVYYKAYQKRISRLGFDSTMIGNDFNIPYVKISNKHEIPISSSSDKIKLSLYANDSLYSLDRFNLWINDIPIYGVKGNSIKNQDVKDFKSLIELKLSQGKNKIQFSCHNEKGVESFKETVEINYAPKEKVEKPELYIIAISVSNYLDERMSLRYAVKDGRDITNTYLSQKELYSKIHVDTLFDKNATKANILKLKQKLLLSKIDDQVIVFVSGHGLLDENFDFYFATYDIDFDYPQYMGITYNSLESLLDSIPARKKLLLMDACHSGEVDKDDIIEVKNSDVVLADGTKSGLKTYTYRSSSNEKNKAALNNSFELMQELFTNLNRGSGAVVISAAAGSGYALESPEWNNGVFTYSVINGIKNKAADENKNKEITVGELQKYVAKEVQKITEGEQKPTARQENLEFDFRVW